MHPPSVTGQRCILASNTWDSVRPTEEVKNNHTQTKRTHIQRNSTVMEIRVILELHEHACCQHPTSSHGDRTRPHITSCTLPCQHFPLFVHELSMTNGPTQTGLRRGSSVD